MVGLVLVSHSRQLAEAACRLAKGVGQQDLPIAFAGGAGDDKQDLGTDATDIMDAVNQVNSGDGVIVLMDLGSAVLSARLAEQMLEGDVPNIRLCPAPLVEGAVAAAIQIGAGADIDAVYNEAKNALGAKVREIAGDEGGQEAPAPDSTPGSQDALVPADALLYRFTMDDPNGMHTRPAADFVKAVGGFKSEVRIRNLLADGPFVNARSLNQIALSNIRRGDISEVAVWGPQAAETLAAIKKLVADVYHGREVENPPAPKAKPESAKPATAQNAPAQSVRLSPGVALGTLYMEEDSSALLPQSKIDDPEKEAARLDAAVAKVHGALDGRKKALGEGMQKEAAILDAQLLILNDAEVLDEVKAAIRKNNQDAASAYQQRMLALADSYRSLPDAYMRERAADIGGVAGLVLAALAGKDAADVSFLSDVIIWAPEVSPALVGRWSGEQLKGILTREGGLTSHVAILAKAMGIPALMGYTPPAGSTSGQKIVVDANRLKVVVNPDSAQTADFEKRRQDWRESLARDLADSKGTAATEDGVRVPVWANIGDIASAEAAVKFGAEGVGLLRTEFLFLDRRLPPDEDEQTQQLTKLIHLFAALPVTIRTLDAGGDKAMPWLEMPPEANPFLGVRGVRLVMRHPDLFKSQLRAILRAGGETGAADLRVMVPMISTLEEVDFAKNMLETAHKELTDEKRAHSWPVRFGIMIETPAAVLRAEKLGERVDFFSIGTNDLTQYVMCAERGSKELANLSDGMHPAVLTAIGLVANSAGRTGTEVAVCGEMAGDPVAAVALSALGVHHLSMNASSIGPVKRAIRKNNVKDLSAAMQEALSLSSAEEVRKLFGKFAE